MAEGKREIEILVITCRQQGYEMATLDFCTSLEALQLSLSQRQQLIGVMDDLKTIRDLTDYQPTENDLK